MKKNILEAAGLYDPDVPVETSYANVEPRLVDLDTGAYVTDVPGLDIDSYDPQLAAKDPQFSEPIPDGMLPGIRRREKYAFVYLVNKAGKLDQVVIPVYGKGLWSTLYGFLAIDHDLNTVRGLTFYEHGETPGLGGEVDNPAWKELWAGKKLFNDEHQVEIDVIKGSVNPSDPHADFRVDGLSGATITSNGVENLLHYWLGPHGFGKYLEHLASEEAHDGEN